MLVGGAVMVAVVVGLHLVPPARVPTVLSTYVVRTRILMFDKGLMFRLGPMASLSSKTVNERRHRRRI